MDEYLATQITKQYAVEHLRHCAKTGRSRFRLTTGSVRFFRPHPSGLHMTLGSTQLVAEMITIDHYWG
jgi:hypothetical protein